MTDDERITLRELLAAEIKTLRDDLHDVKTDVKELKEHQSGAVTWKALGFAVTVGVSTAGLIAAVVNHA